jgi:ribosomal subunit interface protein
MDILVHSEGFTLYDKVRQTVEDKIAKIQQWAPHAIRSRVTLKRLSAHASDKQFAATILVEMHGNDARAEQKAGAPVEAVDLLIEKIEHQLLRKKTEKLARRTRKPRGLLEADAAIDAALA